LILLHFDEAGALRVALPDGTVWSLPDFIEGRRAALVCPNVELRAARELAEVGQALGAVAT
jgi:hypothetical protein